MRATKTYVESYGFRLKKARQAVGLSQDKAAAELGITQSSLSRIERGVQKPRKSALDRVEVFLKKNEQTTEVGLERILAQVKESGELEALVKRIVAEM